MTQQTKRPRLQVFRVYLKRRTHNGLLLSRSCPHGIHLQASAAIACAMERGGEAFRLYRPQRGLPILTKITTGGADAKN